MGTVQTLGLDLPCECKLFPSMALERLQIPSDLGSLWGGEGIKSTSQAFCHEGAFRFTFTDPDSALFLSSLPNIKIQGWVEGRAPKPTTI